MKPRPFPIPSIPWQITGNHWVALPCIHPADASIHALSVLHSGARAAIEFAGSERFLDGSGPALVRPSLEIAGNVHALSDAPLAWERAVNWIPTFSGTIAGVMVRGTLFAPYGRDADVAGAVYALSLENRSTGPLEVGAILDGQIGHRQLRVRTPRTIASTARADAVGEGIVALDGEEVPGMVAMAVAGEANSVAEASGTAFRVRQQLTIPAGESVQVAFYLSVGPERDGAVATVNMLRRRGWKDLLSSTRDALRTMEQSTGIDGVDRLINRNLNFAYFYGVGRALDDAHFYLVRTRCPLHPAGVTVRDWEALMWTIPAVQLADPPLAMELILRMCELHGFAAGRGVQYLDGTLFEPGFSLDGVAAYAIAAERYIRETGDDKLVDEPALADTLYMTADLLASRRDKHVPLYSTEVTLSGETATLPFSLHGNAAVAYALDSLRRVLDEKTAASLEDPDVVRAALMRHLVVDRDGKKLFAAATDLAGNVQLEDDPAASALWLPFFEAIPRENSTYRRTAKGLPAGSEMLVQQCARLLGPESSRVLDWFRRAPLDGGTAAEFVDSDGRAVANGGDASLSGLVAWTAWYAVHAFGERT